MKLLSLFKVILVICCYFFVPMQSASAQIADCVVNMPDGLNSRSDCFVNDQDFSPTPVDDIFIDIMYTEAGTTCGPVNYSGVWTWNPDSYGFQHGSSAPWSQFFVGVLHYWVCSYYNSQTQTYVYDRLTRHQVLLTGSFYYSLVGNPQRIFYTSTSDDAFSMTY